MHDLMEVEAHRISPATTRRPRLLLQFTDDQTGTITPLAETLADLLTNLRRELDQAAPAASLADHALPVPAMPAAHASKPTH